LGTGTGCLPLTRPVRSLADSKLGGRTSSEDGPKYLSRMPQKWRLARLAYADGYITDRSFAPALRFDSHNRLPDHLTLEDARGELKQCDCKVPSRVWYRTVEREEKSTRSSLGGIKPWWTIARPFETWYEPTTLSGIEPISKLGGAAFRHLVGDSRHQKYVTPVSLTTPTGHCPAPSQGSFWVKLIT
jgi:hypothetical protein